MFPSFNNNVYTTDVYDFVLLFPPSIKYNLLNNTAFRNIPILQFPRFVDFIMIASLSNDSLELSRVYVITIA